MTKYFIKLCFQVIKKMKGEAFLIPSVSSKCLLASLFTLTFYTVLEQLKHLKTNCL